jgi:uncharacterized protein Usg
MQRCITWKTLPLLPPFTSAVPQMIGFWQAVFAGTLSIISVCHVFSRVALLCAVLAEWRVFQTSK